MPKRHSIFFDLDGTLSDPYEGISASIAYALNHLGADIPADLSWCIGPPLLESFRKLVGRENASEALRLYRVRYSDTGWRENVVYDGVSDALESLRQDDYLLHVATSKPTVFAVQILEHFNLAGFFDEIYGAELDGTRSDKTELLAWALQYHPRPALMIGDRHHDITGAINNDLRAIGVNYGYGSKEELLDAGAVAIAESPADIPGIVQSLDLSTT